MKSVRWKALLKAYRAEYKHKNPLSFVEKLGYVKEGGNLEDLNAMKMWKNK